MQPIDVNLSRKHLVRDSRNELSLNRILAKCLVRPSQVKFNLVSSRIVANDFITNLNLKMQIFALVRHPF